MHTSHIILPVHTLPGLQQRSNGATCSLVLFTLEHTTKSNSNSCARSTYLVTLVGSSLCLCQSPQVRGFGNNAFCRA